MYLNFIQFLSVYHLMAKNQFHSLEEEKLEEKKCAKTNSEPS
jgi:hypothetical protein